MSLFSEKTRQPCAQVVYLPVGSIRPNPHQPRKSFDWDELALLAQSITQNGLLQPITVRELDANTYELVAGERRLRACKMAGISAVPAIVTTLSEEKSAIFAVIENLQRQDLHFFEEAQAIERLSRNFGMDRERIAKKLGRSPSAISNKLRLLRLPLSVREKILAHGLTERHARALLRLDSEELMNEVIEAVANNSMNVAETEELVSRLTEPGEADEAPAEKPHTVKVFKDIRLFLNTLDHAVKTMRNSGISADTVQRETETYVEYTVRIMK